MYINRQLLKVRTDVQTHIQIKNENFLQINTEVGRDAYSTHKYTHTHNNQQQSTLTYKC